MTRRAIVRAPKPNRNPEDSDSTPTFAKDRPVLKSTSFLLSSSLFAVGILTTLWCSDLPAQSAKGLQGSSRPVLVARDAPAPVQLTMPLMSSEQGRRFQQTRNVPASDVPPPVRSVERTDESSQFADVKGGIVGLVEEAPALGHALPTSATSPLGFPRAAFAIGKSGSSSRSTRSAGVSTTSPVSSAVIK